MGTAAALLVSLQALGALFGAGSAIVSEIAYVRAAKDGVVSRAERAQLAHLARGLRYGMALLLAASLGLVIDAYFHPDLLQPAFTASYWMLIALSLLVVYASWALSRGRISPMLGSTAILCGWWFLAYLALGLFPDVSFGAAVALYVVAVGIFYGIVAYARFLVVPPHRARTS